MNQTLKGLIPGEDDSKGNNMEMLAIDFMGYEGSINTYFCGKFDNEFFNASRDCCTCGGGTIFDNNKEDRRLL